MTGRAKFMCPNALAARETVKVSIGHWLFLSRRVNSVKRCNMFPNIRTFR